MQDLVTNLLERPAATLSVGAFLSGAALLYLVIQRSRRRRLESARESDS